MTQDLLLLFFCFFFSLLFNTLGTFNCFQHLQLSYYFNCLIFSVLLSFADAWMQTT